MKNGEFYSIVIMTVLLALATYRATRLIVWDVFPPARWFREKIVQSRHAPEWLKDLVDCHWCASGWIAGVFVLGTLPFHSVPLPVFVWLAAWGIGAIICQRETKSTFSDDEDEQPRYPHVAGDVQVLGPEIFASLNDEIISWRGQNYVRQMHGGGAGPASHIRRVSTE